MGTTKLTRKEILSEDPVRDAIVQFVEVFRERGKTIGLIAAAVFVLAIGIYGGIQYLELREKKAQEFLGQGMDFFHAQVMPDATDDPYGKGVSPTFRNDKAKYEAAAKEFSAAIERQSFGKVSVVARYYLALCQLQLGRKNEAVQNLESVANSSRNRPVAYLAKRVLATYHADLGNNKAAADILEGMLNDPQCRLPREELSIQLARVLEAQGKHEQAIKVLRDASSQGPAFGVFKQQLLLELERMQRVQVPASGAPAGRS